MARKNKLIGPFGETEKRLGNFSYNIFSSCIVQESIDKLTEAEAAYLQALSGSDNIEEIAQLKFELEAIENSFYIATQIAYQEDVAQ